MKTRIRREKPSAFSTQRSATAAQPDRDGSVIVVVLALLIGLLFLGILLFTDTSQEEINAEYFAGSAKVRETNLDPETLFNNILRQIILGANDNEKHSPFYGGRMSLLPTMYGKDRTPFNGEGIRIIYDSTAGTYYVDNDYDGTPDGATTTHWPYLNHSVAAAQIDLANGPISILEAMPDPDVPWTSPDHHSLFVYYRAQVPQYNAAGTSITGVQTVLIPSYLRPQHLRSIAPANEWYTNAATARLVARPHREHRSVLRSGAIALDTGGNPIRRFISATTGTPIYGDPTLNPFPFPGVAPTPLVQHGLFTGSGGTYVYDEDLDGDGQTDSIYLDMDLGIYTTPDGQKKFVPIVSAKMVSLDALVNANAHGNLARGFQSDGTVLPQITNSYMHRSNQGVSRSEINAMVPLMATFPGAGNPDLAQHRIYFGGDPASDRQLANMEYWWLKTGRPEYQGSKSNILSLYPGVYGEVGRMKTASANPGNPATAFPGPGTTLFDDNGNRLQGGFYTDGAGGVFPNFITVSKFTHPLDYRGTGDYYSSVTQRRLMNIQRHAFASYDSYFYYQLFWPTTLFSNSFANVQLTDEPDELRLDANFASDSPLTAGETVSLHMSDSDRSAVGRDGDRVLQLAPYNFLKSPLAGTIRRLYTTESWDVPSFGKVYYRYGTGAAFRNWEYTSQGGGVYEFPPTTSDPLRPELRQLLAQLRWNTTSQPLMRRLSVNGILDRYPNVAAANVRFRPLTPHPTGLPADPVSGPNSVVSSRLLLKSPEQIGNNGGTDGDKQRQEWLARYDRQRLCRDIYTLLYLFGGGGNLDYTSSNSGNALYSAKQMQDMAQFAVNLVDAMDPDHVITKFEYDTDLSNGWNLDDDPYTDGTDNPPEAGQRGVVYGTEAQTLAFSEALALLTNRTKDAASMPADHAATEYNDSTHHFFTWVELQNVSPLQVDFNANWQIRVVAGTSVPGQPAVLEKRLTLTSGAGSVLAPSAGSDSASRFVIGTHNDPGYTDPADATKIARSLFKVNPQHNEPAPNNLPGPIQLAPYTGFPTLDLMRDSVLSYYVNDPPATSTPADGTRTTSTQADPSGKTLLTLSDMTPATLDGITSSGLVKVKFQLYRRQHLNRSPMTETDVDQSKDNPWVLVDQTTDVPLRVFHLQDPMVEKAAVRTQLMEVRSTGRSQPLDANRVALNSTTGTNPADPTVPPGNYRLNRLGTANTATENDTNLPLTGGLRRFNLWQPHFDRDFASAAELLGLPMYGPDAWEKSPPTQGTVTANLGTTLAPYKINILNTAANYFLRPDLPASNPPTITNPENRWYRLFELLEFPDRNPNSSPWYVNQLGRFGSVLWPRIAGKMCLNTMSHPASLGALLDEQNLLTLNTANETPPTVPYQFLIDNTAEERDWWGQFLLARDGRDPVTGYTLPGVPGISKPFRELNYAVEGQNSLEQTVLRSLPQDSGGAIGKRRLFELGTSTQHTSWSSDTSIDVTTRYRLLNKVLNSTTNRSNVFVLILRIDFFEAKEVAVSNPSFTGEKAVRIGAKLPGAQNPGYLAYFVIDRSKAATLVQSGDLPEQNQDGVAGRFSWRFRQDMDFSSLILHRQRIK